MTTPSAGADLRIIDVTKRFGDFVAVDDLTSRSPPARSSPCSDRRAAARPRRCAWSPASRSPRRARSSSVTRTSRGQAVQAPGQHGVPELRPVPAPRHLRERRVRSAPPRDQGRQEGRRGHARARRAHRRWPSASRSSSPAVSSSGSRWPGRSINQPQVLLLDEPLGALDLKLRRQMQLELKRIQTEVGLTFVHVTHDQEEAMTMADTIAVMNARQGRAARRARRPLREPAHHLRRQLPRSVELLRRRRSPSAAATAARGSMSGHRGQAARSRACTPTPRRCTSASAGEAAHPVPRRRGAARRRQPARLHRERHVVHRRVDPVPGRHPVGPGAHGLRAEHAPRRAAGPRRARRRHLGGRPHVRPRCRAEHRRRCRDRRGRGATGPRGSQS